MWATFTFFQVCVDSAGDAIAVRLDRLSRCFTSMSRWSCCWQQLFSLGSHLSSTSLSVRRRSAAVFTVHVQRFLLILKSISVHYWSYRNGAANTIYDNSNLLLNPNALVVISEAVCAVKLCSVKILKFLTGSAYLAMR